MEELERHADGDGAAWDRTVSEFMPHADLSFGVLTTELWSPAGLKLAGGALRRLGKRGALEFTGGVLASCRDWATATFASEQAHALLAPWVLHTGLGPDAASSGFMTRVIAVAVELGGMPVPSGGGIRLVEALAGIVRDAGGQLETGADVEQVVVRGGRAAGVRLVGGRVEEAREAVVANVTPTQLYDRLLTDVRLPGPVLEAARAYRYGRGGDADPHGALGASALGGRRASREDGDRAPDARARRCLAGGQRGRAGSAAGGGDDRRRSAARGRPVARARGLLDRLDPAAGAPGAGQGGRGRGNRHG